MGLRVFLVCFLAWIGIISFSQNDCLATYSTHPEIQKKYAKAKKQINKGKTEKAIRTLQGILAVDSLHLDSYIALSKIFMDNGNTHGAVSLLSRASALENNKNPAILNTLVFLYENEGDLSQAIHYSGLLLEIANLKEDFRISITNKLSKLIFQKDAMENSVPFEPLRLCDNINSELPEYLPAMGVRGNQMIFVRRQFNQEDFYSSVFENGNWSESEPITELNTPYNEGSHTIAFDREMMIFSSDRKQFSRGNFDLFIVHRTPYGWSESENLGHHINSTAWDAHPSLSPDGRTLYFSSRRKGGMGGKDIWMSQKDSGGNWTTPVNLGKPINTSGNDEAPFIHYDNQTLYFTSSGHLGMGDADIFVSRKILGSWSKPENLGYPINTKHHDGALTVLPDGRTALFASDRMDTLTESLDYDIYEFALPKDASANEVLFVVGRVVDSIQHTGIKATISLINNVRADTLCVFSSDSTGEFSIVLAMGIDYNLTFKSPGYVFQSHHIILNTERDSIMKDSLMVYLEPVDSGGARKSNPIVLENVFFKFNSSKLDTLRSHSELNTLIDFLVSFPDLEIRIEGHTDDIGSKDYNISLSERRAMAVYLYLLAHGISENRLSFKGFGETKPIAPNDSTANRALNRRTEFRIIGN